jgi:hypothetical protein
LRRRRRRRWCVQRCSRGKPALRNGKHAGIAVAKNFRIECAQRWCFINAGCNRDARFVADRVTCADVVARANVSSNVNADATCVVGFTDRDTPR